MKRRQAGLTVKMTSCQGPKQHASHAMQRLNQLRKRGTLCDILIQVEGGEVSAHKNILAIHSDYFMAMFDSGMAESKASQISIEGLNYQGLAPVINFMYTATLQLEEHSHLQDVIVAADLLQMEPLKQQCEDSLAACIDDTNVVGMLLFGEQFNCNRLIEGATTLLQKRFVGISHGEEFLDQPPDIINKLITLKDLNLGSRGEDEILKALMRWLMNERETRWQHLPSLLEKIHIPSVSKNTWDVISQSDAVLSYQSIRDCLVKLRDAPLVEARKPRQHIYAIAGYLQSRTGPLCPKLHSVERYDQSRDLWETVANLPFTPTAVKAFNINGKLICVCVVESNLPTASVTEDMDSHKTNSVLEYDYVHDKWQVLEIGENVTEEVVRCLGDCLIKGGSMTFCDTQQKIFLIDSGSFHCIDVVDEEGEILMDKLSKLSPLQAEEEGVVWRDRTLVIGNGSIYCLGGSKVYSKTEMVSCQSCHQYNAENDTWLMKSSMRSKRAMLTAACIGKCIYAVGGFDTYRLNSAERYNIETNEWEMVAPMLKHRSHACAVVIAEKLYMIGGKSYAKGFMCGGARKVLRVCEVYDPEDGTWTNIPEMTSARCQFTAAVV